MQPRALARPTLAAAVLSCLASFALAGCGGGSDPEDSAASDRTATRDSKARSSSPSPTDATPSTTPSPTQATSPSETVDPDQPADSGRPSGGPRNRLLPASAVPGFNSDFRWTVSDTRAHEPRSLFGTCQQFGMDSIGATRLAVRDYVPGGRSAPTDRAGELVAQFPDATTARRAFAVLVAWRKGCAKRLARYDRSEVGGLENVSVPGGTGGWYLLTYGPLRGDPDSQYFDAQGMAVVGSRIAMVEMVLGGQDYNYDIGHEPAVAAVQRAAARLS